MGQMAAAILDQLFCHSRRGAGRHQELDHSFHFLAELGIRDTKNRHVGHCRVIDKKVLNFLRVDIDAAGNDHK